MSQLEVVLPVEFVTYAISLTQFGGIVTFLEFKIIMKRVFNEFEPQIKALIPLNSVEFVACRFEGT